MNGNRLLIIFSVLFVMPAAIADQEFHAPAPLTVCLSRSTQASVTLQRPKGRASEEVVVVTHGQRELLQWHPACSVTVAAEYRDRVRVTCDPKLCQLQLQLIDVTVEDQGQLVCRNGAMRGPPLDKCGASLRVVDVADLQQSCSYSPSDRTVRCDKVTSEVKIYRKLGSAGALLQDRDVRYFSEPFSFPLGFREEGVYLVTQYIKSEEDTLCSEDFEFRVETLSHARSRGDQVSSRPDVLPLVLAESDKTSTGEDWSFVATYVSIAVLFISGVVLFMSYMPGA